MLKYRKISGYKVKKIVECFVLDIDATKTSQLLKLNRKTINRYFIIFRQAIFDYQFFEFKKFIGKVEVDESYFGAKRVRGYHGKLKRGRGTLKQPVFGIFLRNGKVYTEIIPNCKKRTLQGIIRGRVSLESVIYSDKWRGYDGLVDVGYDRHFRVNHSQNEFAKTREIHINGIESFWSFAKRRLSKFNGVKVNFELHLKECEWRFKKPPQLLQSELLLILSKL